MRPISRTYKLLPFANSRDPNYTAALSVYINQVAAGASTNSNEITSWLDRSYKEFGDEFIILGFQVDRTIVGFAELAFFRSQRILLIDYFILRKDYRSHGEYLQFAHMLREWVDRERFEFDYVVAEVTFESATSTPSPHSVALVRLFMETGFAVIQCEYYQATLGMNNPQSDMRAHLLVFSREHLYSLKRESVLQIVYTIYFHHHERWYSAFIHNIAEYRDRLRRRFAEFERSLGESPEIIINGIQMPLGPGILPPRELDSDDQVKIQRPLVVVFSLALFSTIFVLLQHYVRLEWQGVLFLLVISLVVFVTAFALFSKEGRMILVQLLDAITKVFGKRK